MNTPNPRSQQRLIDGAKRYAQADRSDPFALRRAITHATNGVANTSRPSNQEYDIAAGVYAGYDAEPFRETRKIVNGSREIVFDILSFRNVTRP